jgi:GT2 family glycosyltransferase
MIVVTHDNADIIERCLSAVEAATRRYSQQVLVVDNASVDGTPEVARRVAPDAEVLALDGNEGFAAANNRGMARARGRYIALVNSDCFPDPGAVDALLDAIEQEPSAGLVGGRLRFADGSHQASAGQAPTLRSELWLALGLHRPAATGHMGIGILFSPQLYDRPRRVGWVSGAFCVARREVGPMPDSAFMYGEDVEWAAQAAAKGFEAWLEPRASAVHLGGASVKSSEAAGFVEVKRVEATLRWFARRGRPYVVAERCILCLHAALRLGGALLALPLRSEGSGATVRRFWKMLRAASTTPVPTLLVLCAMLGSA